jgi:hypothetical protein
LIDVAELTRRHILPAPERAKHARTGPDHAFLPGMDTVDGQPPGPVDPLSVPDDPLGPTPPKPHSPRRPVPRTQRRRGPIV